MHLRQIISLWALLALMFGQVSLAQHSASHIDHGVSQEIAISHHAHDEHNEHHHNDEPNKHECPECLLIKSLQTASFTAPALIPLPIESNTSLVKLADIVVFKTAYRTNIPRAPPTFLI